MRPGRELDTLIAKHIFNHDVIIKRKIPTEVTPVGERPLREYSKEIGAAFEVAKKLNISLIPIEGGQWFALAGKTEGFTSPADFISYLSAGNFIDAGAAVNESPSLSICMAAMKAIESKMARETQTAQALI
ncbi:hypothetical protein ACJVC5_00140 [Peredibacter sp. HCB2-198]|uniref:hypothetical protein n=1 Tax=Peredibacter sp. HCB2-198 TaxID=3383025 RepID=UPI0038B5AB99